MTLTIKRKIQIAILLTCAFISAVQSYISISQLIEETTNTITHRVNETSIATSNLIATNIKLGANLLLANEALISTSVDVEREMLLTLRAGGFMSVYAGLDNGDVVYGNQDEVWPSDYDPTTRPWFQQAKRSQQLIFTDPYLDFDGSIVVTMAKAFSGKNSGVVAADMTVDDITKQVEQLQLPNDGFAFLIDGSNQILAHNDHQLLFKSATELSSNFNSRYVEQTRVSGELLTLNWRGDDQSRLVQLTAIAGTDWTLGIVEDEDLAYAGVRSQITRVIVIMSGLFILILILATFALNRMFAPLHKLTLALESLSKGQGDLTQRFEIKHADEIGTLSLHMNAFLQSLQQMIAALVNNAAELTKQANDSSSLVSTTSAQIDIQHRDIDQIATAIHEMSATAGEVANHAETTASAASVSADNCQQGQLIIRQSNTSINQLSHQLAQASSVITELEENTTAINLVLATIQSIAEQTNLLALNAAIEAARAGEQGRGFAVVADEVRVLSHRTQDSTEEIRNMIVTLQKNSQLAVSNMQTSTDIVVESVDNSEKALENLELLTQSITDISDMATQIAGAAEEQRAVSEDISRNTEAVREVSDLLTTQTNSVASNADELLSIAAELNERVAKFKI
ncbi:methyl-accepting chemotaxis protein [Shewanella sp. KX20019]|uniref:methyl-accepting chemotaxis protein n=1 Tax=Shewanella sp. KX20019 TaxID=2803864 RepID=UPI001927BA75|nr:methyl-accepting chemotaxis protein [Shewanella sp. KX20019]QQX79492.1 methyl-accepting chemotaxis protein [Shewanella sp. KX20019]